MLFVQTLVAHPWGQLRSLVVSIGFFSVGYLWYVVHIITDDNCIITNTKSFIH